MSLLLSEFNYEVVYKLGKIYVIPHALNCFNSGEPAIGIKMWLPNEGLHETHEAKVTWKLPIAQRGREPIEDETLLTRYLTLGLFLVGLGEQEQRIYAWKAMPYTIIEGTLYCHRPDEVL